MYIGDYEIPSMAKYLSLASMLSSSDTSGTLTPFDTPSEVWVHLYICITDAILTSPSPVIGGRKEERREPSSSFFDSISSLLSRCLTYIYSSISDLARYLPFMGMS
jgi:hypothetical protein